MRISIFGGGRFGQYVAEHLGQMQNRKIVCYVDNVISLKREFPVISCEELRQKWKKEIDEVWIAVSDYYAVGDIIMQLHYAGISEVYIVKPELWFEKPDITVEELIDSYVYCIDIQKKAVITKLEYHVCDACNLNCTGCSHFAPIFHGGFPAIDGFRQDMCKLAEKFSNILRLRLMGGEPFLNKELSSFVEIAAEYFPQAHLEIVTNGLLLKSVEQHTWDTIRKFGAVLNISLYSPVFAIKDSLEEYLKEQNVLYSFSSGLKQNNEEGIIKEFHKNLTASKIHDPQKAAKYCMGNRCHYLRDGKISKCALPLLMPEINQYFGKAYEIEKTDYVDIYDEALSAWDMVKRLHEAIPFCGYCIEDGPVRFKWSAHKQENSFSDYVVCE